jgi:hypothetical protein
LGGMDSTFLKCSVLCTEILILKVLCLVAVS